MELTGTPLLIALTALAVCLPVATVALWARTRGPRAVRLGQRVGLVVAAQLAAVLATAVAVNDQFSLYESWSDLFGTDPVAAGPVTQDPLSAGGAAGGAAGGPQPSASAAAQGVLSGSGVGPLPGAGRIRYETVTGPTSHVRSKIWVLLPAQYDTPAAAGVRYPVIEFFPGYPGTPTTWLHALELQNVMDAEVAAGRVPPFVAVLPTMNVAAPRDTECVDVVGGPAVAAWLAVDVPAIVGAQVRTLPPGRAWGLAGYSTGGFCAAKLLLTHPQTFGSAAVLAGYFSPSSDVTTGDLFGGDVQLRNENDPMWLLGHRPAPAVHVLAVYSDQDPETLGPTKAFLAAVRPPLSADEIVLKQGGHNTGVWLGVEPQVLQWLGKHLGST